MTFLKLLTFFRPEHEAHVRPPKIQDIRKLLHFIYRYHFTLCIPFLRIIKIIGCINTIKRKYSSILIKIRTLHCLRCLLVCLRLFKRIVKTYPLFCGWFQVLVIWCSLEGAGGRGWIIASGERRVCACKFPIAEESWRISRRSYCWH